MARPPALRPGGSWHVHPKRVRWGISRRGLKDRRAKQLVRTARSNRLYAERLTPDGGSNAEAAPSASLAGPGARRGRLLRQDNSLVRRHQKSLGRLRAWSRISRSSSLHRGVRPPNYPAFKIQARTVSKPLCAEAQDPHQKATAGPSTDNRIQTVTGRRAGLEREGAPRGFGRH